LDSFNIKKQFHQQNAGGTQKFIALGLIRKLKVNTPTLPEQQKIAAFLSSVDEKLQQLGKKKSLLSAYKKGVMQKIFSQELRFKDANGNNYPDWEEKKLGDISTKTSSNITANSIEENVGNFQMYGASGKLKKVDFYREEEEYIAIVKDGAGVGRTVLCESQSSVLGTMDVIKPKEGNNLYFVYSTLNQIHFEKYTTGSTIPHIYFKDYSKEKIKVPVFEEQQKIANFLSAIDTKIDLVSTQIENTQAFKKGLLQQMFV
jgi:type I restriction enzyme S subunit